MKLQFIESNKHNGRRAIALIAETEQDDCLITSLVDAFHKGSVAIEGRAHGQQSGCLECLAAQRYKDCVIASATFGMEQTNHDKLVKI